MFSTTAIGPIFFEFIQRKGDDGFGEGNCKALFNSIEADQIARGVLTARVRNPKQKPSAATGRGLLFAMAVPAYLSMPSWRGSQSEISGT